MAGDLVFCLPGAVLLCSSCPTAIINTALYSPECAGLGGRSQGWSVDNAVDLRAALFLDLLSDLATVWLYTSDQL